jgi:hypothetical protein
LPEVPLMSRTEPLRLDYLIKARAVYSMSGGKFRSVGVRGPEIVAVSADAGGLDYLAGAGTVVVNAADLTVLPAFADSHEHLVEASRNSLLLPVDEARSVAEFTAMVATAAAAVPAGQWILTSIGWHESNLAENRLPHPGGAGRRGTAASGPGAAGRAPGGGQLSRAPGSRSHRPGWRAGGRRGVSGRGIRAETGPR